MLSPQEALICLNLIPGLGSVRIQSLLEFFGSADLVLEAPIRLLAQAPRVGDKLAAAIADWRNCTNLRAEMDLAQRCGVRLVTLMDEEYPRALRRMSDAPIVLYVKGEILPKDSERAVAIVGTRIGSPYGMNAARRFGRELADFGCSIISGLARGIDTAAHWGALDAGGRSIAVLGNGLAHLFPPENRELAERLTQGHGALVSEFPMGMRPSKNSFPQRNRIVAAWCSACLVAEAPAHSGALHTAGLAAGNYGRQVFAIPGPVDRPSSAGCHALIRDGAILCSNSLELIDDMGWRRGPQQMELLLEEQISLPEEDRSLLQAVENGFDTLDALCSALGCGARELTPRLMRLQVEGHLLSLPGCRYGLRPPQT